MQAESQELWCRLEELEIDDLGAAYRFSARLAKENGWTLAYARRVIGEYKRFLFMSVAADHVVCPSDQVDQAWHLHLTYTRSYWEALCRDTLGRPLHHEATRGGVNEHAKHVDLYQRTLSSYRLFFGAEPPADIWPSVASRFGKDQRFRRLNLSRYWVLPRPRWLTRGVLSSGGPRTSRNVTAFTLTASFLALSLNPFNLPGPMFLVFYAALYLCALIGGVILRRVLTIDPPATEARELGPYDVACLAHDERVAVSAAICRLVHDGFLKIAEKATKVLGLKLKAEYVFVAGEPISSEASPLERAIYQRAAAAGSSGASFAELHSSGQPEAADIAASLQRDGLLRSGTSSAARWLPAVLMYFVLGVGATKVVVGLMRGRPVIFLIIGCVIAFVTACLFLKGSRRTAAGERILKDYQTQAKSNAKDLKSGSLTGDQVALAVGILGAAALVGTSLEPVRAAWAKNIASHGGGSSGCGAGCGGGCGGGGCGGGCGGCGGD